MEPRRVVFIRHGESSGAKIQDPGLSDEGVLQAEVLNIMLFGPGDSLFKSHQQRTQSRLSTEASECILGTARIEDSQESIVSHDNGEPRKKRKTTQSIIENGSDACSFPLFPSRATFAKQVHDGRTQIWSSPMRRAIQTTKNVFKSVFDSSDSRNNLYSSEVILMPDVREFGDKINNKGSKSHDLISSECFYNNIVEFTGDGPSWDQVFEEVDSHINNVKRVDWVHKRIVKAFSGDCADIDDGITSTRSLSKLETIYIITHATFISYYLLKYGAVYPETFDFYISNLRPVETNWVSAKEVLRETRQKIPSSSSCESVKESVALNIYPKSSVPWNRQVSFGFAKDFEPSGKEEPLGLSEIRLRDAEWTWHCQYPKLLDGKQLLDFPEIQHLDMVD